MADKQSLYALLGLDDKASPDDIQAAHDTLRRRLEEAPDSEDRHNRLAVIAEARDVLLDRRRRAGYDRRQRERRRVPGDGSASLRRAPLAAKLALVAIAVLAFAALKFFAGEPPPATATAVPPAPALPPRATPAPEPVAADIAALLPRAPAAPAAAPALPAPPPTRDAPGPEPRPLTDHPQANTVRAIADSTFAILGGGGLGTGVAIEPDKLLTNCHVIAPNVRKGDISAINSVTGARARITAAAFLIREDACVAIAPGLAARPMAIGNAAQLKRGDPIYSLGFATGQLSFSTGTLLGVINRQGQEYLVTSNYCDQGISGGPLVDAAGRLVGLTSGGPRDRSFCLSLTAETARRVLEQVPVAIDAFPDNYLTNLTRRW